MLRRLRKGLFIFIFLFSAGCLLSIESFSAPYTEPFFVTVERVELKNESGEWVKVIEPDHRFDLLTEEPVVQFFNNRRIAPGNYSNVRVITRLEDHPHPIIFEKKEDYSPPVVIGKGTYIRVQFYFDFSSGSRLLDEKTIYRIRLTVDESERVDNGTSFKFTNTI